MFDRSLYNEAQLSALNDGLNPACINRGDISDIDPRTHSAEVMDAHSTTRTDDMFYGCIRDLVGTDLDYHQLVIITMSRGDDPEYGPIEDLISLNLDGEFLAIFSEGRGSNEELGNVDRYIGSNLSGEVLSVVSLGLGSSDWYGDISDYPHLDMLEEYHADLLSLGKGTNPNYSNIWDIPDLWTLSESYCKMLSEQYDRPPIKKSDESLTKDTNHQSEVSNALIESLEEEAERMLIASRYPEAVKLFLNKD